jgi:hypothetical protein
MFPFSYLSFFFCFPLFSFFYFSPTTACPHTHFMVSTPRCERTLIYF